MERTDNEQYEHSSGIFGHDIRLKYTTIYDYLNVTRKTHLYDSIDSMRTQPLRWLAVRICLHAMI